MNDKPEIQVECPSVTYALKGKELLKNKGYNVRVKKITRKNRGCGYAINVLTNESMDFILRLLWDNGIKASKITD